MQPLSLFPLLGIGSVEPGSDLSQLLLESLAQNQLQLQHGDVLVLAQKIVSKSEGRFRKLSEVEPSAEAIELAATVEKDPRLIHLVLEESTAVVRAVPHVLIVRHRSGHVMANAGIDASNLEGDADEVLLLPEDSDASADALRQALQLRTDSQVGVVIADSFGRPWRNGVTNVAIGVAGIPALLDKRSAPDRVGRPMQVTQVAVGDLVASAAGLLMGETSEGIPAVLLRGLSDDYLGTLANRCDSRALVRPLEQDLFGPQS